jgi:hypothetical protein
MTENEGKSTRMEPAEERCDIRTWSGMCRSDSTNISDKYLCASCGTIPDLDHEVRHETFPYISGDEDNLY